MEIVFCIPVFNDWSSAAVLLRQIDRECAGMEANVRILFIDDASTEGADEVEWEAPAHLSQVSVLGLRRNLGHQRAIAIGLAHLQASSDPDCVVVMDADGEDRPSDVPRLLQRCTDEGFKAVVFAGRNRRSEGSAFRLGYLVYRLLHRVLVGQSILVGNFSVVPRACLTRLVCVAELWNHYAASVYVSRLPHHQIPTERGKRIFGKSKMNFVALVIHGLSSISVHSETVAVRILFLVGMATSFLLFSLISVAGIRLGTDLAIPGWATTVFGFIFTALINLSLVSAVVALFVLHGRSGTGFIPTRDHVHFKAKETMLFPRQP